MFLVSSVLIVEARGHLEEQNDCNVFHKLESPAVLVFLGLDQCIYLSRILSINIMIEHCNFFKALYNIPNNCSNH